jgi:hypothetical protein
LPNSESCKAILHSRYNPTTEAERYINALSLRKDVDFFILIEPGVGYMIPPLQKKFPYAKIVCLHVEDVDVQAILEREIPDVYASSIEIIEWKPSQRVFGEKYLRLLAETAVFIKRVNANKCTTDYFSKRWFSNFFKNVDSIKKFIIFKRFDKPIIVVGAGPCLEASMQIIKVLQKKGVFVLAVSAAYAALLKNGILPDMVVTSDGGNWAVFHLFEPIRFCRQAVDTEIPIAATMNAALPAQILDSPVLPITDGSLWQNIVLKTLGFPFFSMPQRGTVTAHALDLAFTLTPANVFITGMDLANRDILAHVRPYALDFHIHTATRLKPLYSSMFVRATDNGFAVYADWFERRLNFYPKRLFTIGENHQIFSSLPVWTDTKVADERFRQEFHIISLDSAAKGIYGKKAVEILLNALKDDKYRREIIREIGELLSCAVDEKTIIERAGIK